MSIKQPNYALPRASSSVTGPAPHPVGEAPARLVAPQEENVRIDAFSRRGQAGVPTERSVDLPPVDRFQAPGDGGWRKATSETQAKALAEATVDMAEGAVAILGGVAAATAGEVVMPGVGIIAGAGAIVAGTRKALGGLANAAVAAGGGDPATDTVGDMLFEENHRSDTVGAFTETQQRRNAVVGRQATEARHAAGGRIASNPNKPDMKLPKTSTGGVAASRTGHVTLGEIEIHDKPLMRDGLVVESLHGPEAEAIKAALTDASKQKERLLGRSGVTGQVAGEETVRPGVEAEGTSPTGAPQAPVLPDQPAVHDAARVHDLAVRALTQGNAGLGAETSNPNPEESGLGEPPLPAGLRGVIRG